MRAKIFFARRKLLFAFITLSLIIVPKFALSKENVHVSNDSSVARKFSSRSHSVVTNELIKILNDNHDIKGLLIKSINAAKKINPDKDTNPAQTLEEFYDYIDWSLQAMPWKDLRKLHYPKIYENLDQSLDYFYFILDQPLQELKNKGLYYNSLQYYEPIRSWIIRYIKRYGAHLDTKGSWNENYYKAVYEDNRFGLQNDWYEKPSKWHTFNEFFSRKLKSAKARPIADKDDDSVVVSPADSVPEGVWRIDSKSNIIQQKGVLIKSSVFYSIPKLLGEDSAYKNAFARGYLTHTFLNVQDYHRYHFPVGGIIKEVRVISQDDAAGGITTWDRVRKKYVLDSRIPGWQSIETRGLVIVETKDYGVVALLPVGMSQVSSVNFEKNVRPGKKFKKGDPLGYFLFGGSDFIMVFQEKANFRIVAPKSKNEYKHILMGEKYGILNFKSSN